MAHEGLSALIVIVAFGPIALLRLAPESRKRTGLYHALAIVQLLVSLGLFAVLPLQVFFMYWCILPAAFAGWHFWRVLKPRAAAPLPRPPVHPLAP